jgi:hypothetical protein
MLSNAFLVTSALIETNEVESFVIKFGGSIPQDSLGEGWIPRGECFLSISFGPQCGPEILADAIIGREKTVSATLGAPPRSCVNLVISRPLGSEILAVDFTVAFAERWPSIVIDVERHVLNLAELKPLQREGKGFGTDSPPTA